jgi:hypothetical protein
MHAGPNHHERLAEKKQVGHEIMPNLHSGQDQPELRPQEKDGLMYFVPWSAPTSIDLATQRPE